MSAALLALMTTASSAGSTSANTLCRGTGNAGLSWPGKRMPGLAARRPDPFE